MAQETSGNTFQSPTTNDQLSRLCSAVQLDDISLNTLRSLSSLTHDFRQSTTAVHRIQTGSPNARHLGPTVQNYQSKFGSIAGQCQQIFTKHSQFPGMGLLQTRFNELQQTLGAGFDDSSKGYGERVHVLEKLNYENGTLRGVVETIIEHHKYWKNKLAGLCQENKPPVARRLTFSDIPNSQSATTPAFLTVDQHRQRLLAQLQVSQNQPATLSSNQPFQLGQATYTFPTQPAGAVGGTPFILATTATQAQKLGSEFLFSGCSQSLPPTTSGTTGMQVLPRPKLGSSQSGLGNSTVVTHSTQQPRGSTATQVSSSGLGNRQFGPNQLGLAGPLNLLPLSSNTMTQGQNQVAKHSNFFGPNYKHALSSIISMQTGGTSFSSQNPQQVGLGGGGLFQQVGAGLGHFKFSQGLGGLSQQASSLTSGTGAVTTAATQAQPQRNLNPTFGSPLAQQLGGLNLNAPVISQPNSSSVAVSTAQPSDLVTATLASQRQRVMYIPRQPMSQAGGSNNPVQESVAPNTENAEEQNSSQNSGFSCKLNYQIWSVTVMLINFVITIVQTHTHMHTLYP